MYWTCGFFTVFCTLHHKYQELHLEYLHSLLDLEDETLGLCDVATRGGRRRKETGKQNPLWVLSNFREKHVAIYTFSHVLQVDTHVTRCASLLCVAVPRCVHVVCVYVCMWYVCMCVCVYVYVYVCVWEGGRRARRGEGWWWWWF